MHGKWHRSVCDVLWLETLNIVEYRLENEGHQQKGTDDVC